MLNYSNEKNQCLNLYKKTKKQETPMNHWKPTTTEHQITDLGQVQTITVGLNV